MTSFEGTPRDKLVRRMMADLAKLGMTTTVDSVLRSGIISGIMKRLIVGSSTYSVVQWLNMQRRRAGLDVQHVYDEVYDQYKEDMNAL